MIEEFLKSTFTNKNIVLLGFGREGQSTFSMLRQVFPDKEIAIADQHESVMDNPVVAGDTNVRFILGPDYLSQLDHFDVIIRSPGIPVWSLMQDNQMNGKRAGSVSREKFTSQTDLFLSCYSRQVIGITGTKGKSTTSSLIRHIFKTAGRDVVLAGNIGNPVFHFAGIIKPDTTIVLELSSHQLEILNVAPRISVLLNLFQEHLDAYENYQAYQDAKLNIARYQFKDDYLVYNADDPLVVKGLGPFLVKRHAFPFSLNPFPGDGGYVSGEHIYFTRNNVTEPVWKIHQDRFLRGEHNLKNIMAAMNVAMLSGIEIEMIQEGIMTFKGLEHRLEYVGEYRNIHFYNDSIATIPEACMEAVRAIPGVDTLIAGGFDRGIEYDGLAAFLCQTGVRNLILVGAAGKRIMECLRNHDHTGKEIFLINRFDDFREIAFRVTRPGYVCLLSPAAASYDEFRNFEERGLRFREMVRS